MNLASTSVPRSQRVPFRAWRVTAALLALAAVPSLTGLVRLLGLLTGRPMFADVARLDAFPVPLVLHIVGSTGFAVLGAFQFSAPLQRRRWHRVAGRVAVVLGVVGALAAMWIAVVVPPSPDDAPWLRGPRFAAGFGMLACLLAGFLTGREDLPTHRAWMTRAYALALGAGTQVFTAAPYLLLLERRSETVYSLLLVLGWVINLAVAERVLRRRKPRVAPAAALILGLVARPAHAEDPARVAARLETAAEVSHDARIRDGAGALSAGVVLAGAGVASWVTPSQPDARTARDVAGGVLVGLGSALVLGGTYALATPSELELQREAYVAALRAGGPEATAEIVRDAERALAARAKAAKTERVAEAVVSFVFGALEIGGGLLLQARADDDGLVWLGRGLVASGVGAGILGVSSLAVRSEHERTFDAWQRDRALPAPSSGAKAGVRLGLGTVGLAGTF